MNRLRNPNSVLILLFVGLIAAVPLVQTFMEATQENGEGVIALNVFGEWPTAAGLRAFEDKMETANWAARHSRQWLQAAQFATLKEGGDKVVVCLDGWYFFKPGLKYMLARHEPAAPSNATNDPIAAIIDFRDQLARRGVNLLLMPVPNKDSIYPDRLTPRAQVGATVLAPRTREVMEKLRAANIEMVDLFKEFAEARRKHGPTDPPLYLAQDTHWSPAGVDIAAKAVARRLAELGWAQPGSIEYREKPAPVQRLGDILRMLQAPLIERRVPPENVPAVQIVQGEQSELYKDDVQSEILVLGDSFMRIYQTDIPNSAGFIAHLAKELKQPLLSLVNDGGGATLVREELSSRPFYLNNRKIVVWEFVERDIGIAIKGWPRITLPPIATNLPARQEDVKKDSR